MKFLVAIVAILALSTGFAHGQEKNIAQIASETPDLSILVEAAKAAGLVDALANPSANITVFAPTNSAFEALIAALNTTAADLLSQTQLLQTVVGYHVVPGLYPSSSLMNGEVLETSIMRPLTVKINGMEVQIVPTGGSPATVVGADIMASNGIVHVIDAVLLPAPNTPAPEMM